MMSSGLARSPYRAATHGGGSWVHRCWVSVAHAAMLGTARAPNTATPEVLEHPGVQPGLLRPGHLDARGRGLQGDQRVVEDPEARRGDGRSRPLHR